MPSYPITTPAEYVPPLAIAYADASGHAALVSAGNPLPVVAAPVAAAAPLAGSAGASATVGPFNPVAGRGVILALGGGWSGSVSVLRSTDGGTTMLPLTEGGAPSALYTANCCEQVWNESEAVATLYLQITLLAGTVTYRMAQ